jgi:hypothetical protein
LLFFYHGRRGIKIRRARRAKAPLPFPAIKRHRGMGPVLTILGMLGFSIGFTLVLLDTGRILEYPAHLFTGLAIVILLISTWVISRRIKGPDSPFRTPHFILGIAILCLYFIEAFLGIGVALQAQKSSSRLIAASDCAGCCTPIAWSGINAESFPRYVPVSSRIND